MTFELYISNGEIYTVCNIISFELISEADAVCDALRLKFCTDGFIDECCAVKAYFNGELVFNGFCDTQKTTVDKSGVSCFIYARSSAAVLVDNEAVPRCYTAPTARQLWLSNAGSLGFECALPQLYSENSYLVSKGTSCYGAINDFVYAVCGSGIYVTPDNVLAVYSESDRVKRLSDYNTASLSYTINRSELISDIDYKISSAEPYSHHFTSRLARNAGIERRRLLNLSSLPVWQRELAAKRKLEASLLNYHCVTAELAGICDFRLYDRVEIDSELAESGVFTVFEVVKSRNENGDKTTLVMKRKIDGEIVNYVA